MANALGYEALIVGSTAVSPTASIVQGGVACAVFFVDPDSTSPIVRYRPDGTAPRPDFGLPIRRGKSIVIAGEANIRRSSFIAQTGTATVHAIYYDRVDIIDMHLDTDDLWTGIEAVIKTNTTRLEEILEYQKAILLALSLVADGESFIPEDVLGQVQ